jgi:hypothetical protein
VAAGKEFELNELWTVVPGCAGGVVFGRHLSDPTMKKNTETQRNKSIGNSKIVNCFISSHEEISNVGFWNF